jgi:hypothetical protein
MSVMCQRTKGTILDKIELILAVAARTMETTANSATKITALPNEMADSVAIAVPWRSLAGDRLKVVKQTLPVGLICEFLIKV